MRIGAEAIWGLADRYGGSKAHLAQSGNYRDGFESYCGTHFTVEALRGYVTPPYPAGAEKCGSCLGVVARLAAEAAAPAPEYVSETLVVTVTRPAKHQPLDTLVSRALDRRTGWEWSIAEMHKGGVPTSPEEYRKTGQAYLSVLRSMRDRLRAEIPTKADHAIPNHRADERFRELVEEVIHEGDGQ